MTDIVKRLCAPVSDDDDYMIGQWPGEPPKKYDALRLEAADEIGRLRKDLSLAVFADNEYWQVLEKENERLRAALEKIVNGPRDADLDYLDLFVEVKMEARAALETREAGVSSEGK